MGQGIRGYSRGALSGATHDGGAHGAGTVYRDRERSGSSFSSLHHFQRTDASAGPSGDVIQGADGALYGTTPEGGAWSYSRGTVFRLLTDGSTLSLSCIAWMASMGALRSEAWSSGRTAFSTGRPLSVVPTMEGRFSPSRPREHLSRFCRISIPSTAPIPSRSRRWPRTVPSTAPPLGGASGEASSRSRPTMPSR